MSLDIAFLGTGSGYPTPFRGASCMALRKDGEVYLIDCGEGSQTQIMKLKLIRPGRVTKIFITHLHGDHLFGLPGLLCTISMAYKSNSEEAEGIEKEEVEPSMIEIFGPSGLRRFLRETLSLSRSILAFQYVVHELIPKEQHSRHGKNWDIQGGKWTPELTARSQLHVNECKMGRAIFYDPSLHGWMVHEDEKVKIMAGQLRHRIPAFGFVFSEPPKPGRLDSQKLRAAGVPPGPLYGKIKNGETVTLENGTVIDPGDYIGPEQPGRKVSFLQDTCDSWGAFEICKNCDVMVHEATNENAHYEQCVSNGHSTPSMAARFASEAGASTLILTHFSQRYKDAKLHENLTDDCQVVDKLSQEASVDFSGLVVNAYDGLIFPVTRKVELECRLRCKFGLATMGAKMLDNMSETVFFCVSMMAAILVRWSVGSGSHSGMRKPPMFGDYEAQRHWQEITINTPVTEWYRNTSKNNLQYWGLDYPPLTAYHSWVLGKIAKTVNPEWVVLFESRGTEGYYHKLFMRYSVLLADLLLFFPAVYLVHKGWKNRQVNREALLATLFFPGLILIDYGHFQYNNISLGLFLLATYFLQRNHNLLGSAAFCLALNYKQMELYHSIPFFCYLLANSMQSGLFSGAFKVSKLGITVLATFAICWLPFLTSAEDTLVVVGRLFPVNRGLYEDKVANFWCSISPVLKLKDIVSSSDILKICIAATLMSSAPSALHLLWRPSIKAFNYSCITIPLGFFLFSYQVHEKSILIPAVSACLVYAESPFLISWFLHISTFSMVPLLQKDGLMLQFYATRYMFMLLTYTGDSTACRPSAGLLKSLRSLSCNVLHQSTIRTGLQILVFCSLCVSEGLVLLLLFAKPPARFPDLWPVAISAYSCAHFLIFLALFITLQYRLRRDVEAETKKQS